jgi:Tol biopolymer transport system component
VDSGDPAREVYATAGVAYPKGWLPDGRLIVSSQEEGPIIIDLDGRVDESASNLPSVGQFEVSPDGRWATWAGNATGQTEVYAQPFGRPGPQVPVSTGGGRMPMWSLDGRYIYFLSGLTLYEARVRTGDQFSTDPPVRLFTLDREVSNFDVSPDRQRFLVLKEPPADFLPIRVLVNWPAILRR